MSNALATTGRRDEGTLLMEGAKIVWRNFAGEEGMFNAKGDRNFCVMLDQETAAQMQNDGWNVKFTKPREEGDVPNPYIQVSLKYWSRDGKKLNPPTCVIISSKGRTKLNEEEVEVMDWVDIRKVDLIIRPFRWSMPSGASGVKAMLKSIYITIEEDYLEQKYADLPEYNTIGQPLAIGPGQDIIDGEVIDGEIVEEF